MTTPETTIPKMHYPAMPREGTVERLKVAAQEAEQNVVRMSRRKKYDSAQYYAGRRDGLRLAVEMLERE